MNVTLRRINRTVAATGPGGGPLPPPVRNWLVSAMTYHSRKYVVDWESGGHYEFQEEKQFAFDSRGDMLFPLGLLPRITAGLRTAGVTFDVVGKTIAELKPDAFVTDVDGLLSQFTIYPGQDEALIRIVKSEGGLITAPTGTGKSVIIRMICRLYPKAKIHIVTRAANLADEIVDDVSSVIPGVGMYGAGRKRPGRVTVFVADSLHYGMGDADLVLLDECFTGDTEILVPGGTRRIENVRPGDVVYCATGTGVVESVFTKPADALYELELSSGEIIRCTGDHPFFTDNGWIPACAVDGKSLYRPKDVFALWNRIPTAVVSPQNLEQVVSDRREPVEPSERLLEILLEEAQEPDARSGERGQGECGTSDDRPQTSGSRWKRATNALAAAANVVVSGSRMDGGIRGRHENEKIIGIPETLQTGLGESRQEDCVRDRRLFTCLTQGTGEGRQEDQLSDRLRVVRVSRSEHGRRTAVYNLRVSGHPSYFANGVLVHNCHELVAPKYMALIGGYRCAKVFGFTASPQGRHDGRDVEMEAVCGPVLYTVSYQESQADGRVVPIAVEWLRFDRGPDLSGADPTTRDRIGVWCNDDRNRTIADRVRAFGPDVQTMIMVKTIDHAVQLKRFLPEYTMVHGAGGMEPDRLAAYIDQGLLPSDEPLVTAKRLRDLRRRFAAGTLKKVIANYVWSTGVNFKRLEVLVRADASASEIKSVQIPGRVCRRVAGVKESAVLIDCWDAFDPTLLGRSRARRTSYRTRGWSETINTKQGAT